MVFVSIGNKKPVVTDNSAFAIERVYLEWALQKLKNLAE
jgi:hypothetical protein